MNSKGVTPVIATVLLMTITVAATASAYTFMTGIQDDFMENTEDRLSSQEREAQSDINIETAYNSSDGYVLLSVRNTGSVTLEVEDENDNKAWDLYIEGRPNEWKHRGQEVDSIAPK
jgi:flagellin-like protein